MNKGLKEQIINLFEEGKSYNVISKTLNCSRGTVSYHLRNKVSERSKNKKQHKLEIIETVKKEKLTKEEFDKKYKQFFTSREYKEIRIDLFPKQRVPRPKIVREDKIIIDSKYYKERRDKLKKECIEYKGGQCLVCGYKKCNKALCFHHLDPNLKDFTISGRLTKIEKLYAELDKCVLLCHNCHCEVHDGLITVEHYIRGDARVV